MFCLLYLFTFFMIQPIQCTGLSEMAWQNYCKQKTIYYQSTHLTDASVLKAYY